MPKILYLPTITFLSFPAKKHLGRTVVLEECLLAVDYAEAIPPGDLAKQIIHFCTCFPYSARTHFEIPIGLAEIPRQEQFEIIYYSPGETNVLE